MPSRRSPSQRTPEGRQGRQMAAQSIGTNGGRTISASGRVTDVTTVPDADAGGDSTHPGTGADSIQLGPGADASGDSSTAIGSGAGSSATNGTALGTGASADGASSVAIGTASAGTHGIAIGPDAGSGDYNIAIGINAGPLSTDAAYTGGGCVDIGDNARSIGHSGIAVGHGALTTGIESIAVGVSARSPGDHGVALGKNARAAGLQSVALGYGAQVFDDYAGRIQVDTFEVSPVSPAGTALILSDSDGIRWQITVDTSGNLTTTAI